MCSDTTRRAPTPILIPGRLKYDRVVHAFGFGATTWVCWPELRELEQVLGSTSLW